MNISVSVIVPCHNCAEWVGRAINSVLAQTYLVKEILLIENNSTDNTLQILHMFESEHPSLIKVYISTEKGACAARNFGLIKARGEWVQFLDADDELLSKKIEDQIRMVDFQKPDVIIGNYNKVTQYPDGVHKIAIVANDDPWVGLINSKLGITSANLWRRESLVAVNGLNEALSSSQEYDLMFRLLQQKYKFIIDHGIKTIVYKQSESISTTDNPAKKTQILIDRYNLRLRVLQYMQSNNLLSDLYEQESFKRLYTILMSIRQYSLPVFEEQIKQTNFSALSFRGKLKAYYEFICSSPKIKYRRRNLVLRTAERYFYIIAHINLLKY
jgi:glycosyltransferase involved in cell wall biosynthesis